MRIGFDAKRAFNNHRGLGNYSRETLRILTTLSPENQYFLFTPKIDPTIRFTVADNAVIQLPNNGNGKFSQSLWRTFDIAKEAQAVKLDLYHGLSHEIPHGIEKTGIKTVVTMHDLLFLKHPEWFPAFDRWMYRKKYLDSCQRADRIIAVSEQTRHELLEITKLEPEKVEVVYQGCSPMFRETASHAQRQLLKTRYGLPDTYLLTVGAIEPRKNHKLLLKALVDGHLDIPLVIAGRKTNYLTELQQDTIEYSLQKQVFWLPDFPAEDLPALYQGASLFLFPSLDEGFGIPIVEALESGLPIIAASGSCLEESAGPQSRFASPDQPDAWAEQIDSLMHDENTRDEMGRLGKMYAQRFSDASINEHLTRIYKTLLP